MHRNPRYADTERIIGALTACPGAAVLIMWAFAWESRLLERLAGGWGWAWIIVFMGFGTAMWVASYMWDMKVRLRLLYGCTAMWVALAVSCIALKMPLATAQALVILLFCLRAIRVLRHDGR